MTRNLNKEIFARGSLLSFPPSLVFKKCLSGSALCIQNYLTFSVLSEVLDRIQDSMAKSYQV